MVGKPHDLIVLSDLHLGEGLREDEPRYSPTEDFFYDRQFAAFLDALTARYKDNPAGLVLVLNGDVFDFLTVTRTPTPAESAAAGLEVTSAEKKFGLNPTAVNSVYKLDVIARGHKLFFQALARFVGAGYRVEIIRGNHDLELHFPAVRKRLLEILAGFEGGPALAEAEARIGFHEWFYLEPGRVYIEHGNQYDKDNSIRYPLRPLLPARRWWKTGGEEALDYPIGSIFVRFFYNRVRQLDPYSPRMLSFDQYVEMVRRYNLFDVWRVYRNHYPHFLEALAPVTPTTTGSAGYSYEEDTRQEAEFERLEREQAHGSLYRELNRLKLFPVSASKPYVVKEMIMPMIKRGIWLGVFAFLALFLWFGVLQLIDEVPRITGSAFLMSLFSVATLGVAFWSWVHLQRKLRRSAAMGKLDDMVRIADKIARLVPVRLVLMGHSHIVDYRGINGGKAVYANSGTWTSVDNPWNRIMRDARRYTFLYVQGDQVELKRWNDDAGRIDPVPLLDIREESVPDRVNYEQSLDPIRTEHSWLPSAAAAKEDKAYLGDDAGS